MLTVIGAAGATGSVRRARLVLRIQTSFGGGTSSALSSWAARAAASPRKSCTTPTVIRPPAASTRVIRAACLPSVRSVDPAVVPAGLEVGGVALGEGGEVGAGDDGPAAGDEVGATAGSVLSLQPDPSSRASASPPPAISRETSAVGVTADRSRVERNRRLDPVGSEECGSRDGEPKRP